MATQSKSKSRVLTNHDEIRRWAEERGAKPASVSHHTGEGYDPGILRLDFPGYSGEGTLEQVDWNEWFEAFEDNDLALLVQDTMADGKRSNFNKLISRHEVSTQKRAA